MIQGAPGPKQATEGASGAEASGSHPYCPSPSWVHWPRFWAGCIHSPDNSTSGPRAAACLLATAWWKRMLGNLKADKVLPVGFKQSQEADVLTR